MILSPKVEIIRDEQGMLLAEPVIVSVLTCAAPVNSMRDRNISDDEYEKIVYQRIRYMLRFAAHSGYRELVLGAWGCGAFGNDARIVSDAFERELKKWNTMENILSEKSDLLFWTAWQPVTISGNFTVTSAGSRTQSKVRQITADILTVILSFYIWFRFRPNRERNTVTGKF